MKSTIKIQFTILLKEDGILTKRMYLDDQGQLAKDPTPCSMPMGIATIHKCNFCDLPTLLRQLGKNRCLVHGIFDSTKYGLLDEYGNNSVGIVTKKVKLTEIPYDNRVIARSKEYFHHPASNALTMFDYDVDKDDKVLSTDEYIQVMSAIVPGFAKCAKVITPSTSAFIHDASGTLLSGSKPSFHMYFTVKDGSDIKRFKKVLGKRCWLHGHGKIKLNSRGGMLNRTIFDPVTFRPSQPDFVSGAVCEDGLVQKLPEPKHIEGGVLDTSLLPDLTPEEEVEYNRLVHDAKQPYSAQYEELKAIRISKEIKDNNWSEGKADSHVEDNDVFILWDQDKIITDHGEEVPVKTLLDNGEQYDKTTMPDVFEPEKGKNKAIFYWNDGNNPIINSFLHGGQVYRFKRSLFRESSKIQTTDKEPTFGGSDDFITKTESRKILAEELEGFFVKSPENKMLIMGAGIGKSRTFMKVLSNALQKTQKLYGIKVAYFVPNNQISNELLQEYHDEKNLVGMSCMIRGRSHYNEHLSPPCRWAEIFKKDKGITEKEYQQKTSMINAGFCRECYFRKQPTNSSFGYDPLSLNENILFEDYEHEPTYCEYFQQFQRAKSAQLVFLTHNQLFFTTNELTEFASTVTHVVIDEDIVNSHILNNGTGTGVYTCYSRDSEVAVGIIDDIEKGAEMKHVLLNWRNQIEDEYNNNRSIEKPTHPCNIDELQKNSKRNAIVDYRCADKNRIFWRLLKNITKDLQQHQNSNVSVNNVWVDGHVLKVGRKQKISHLWHKKKKLYLDATADEKIVQEALDIKFKVKKIKTNFHDGVVIKQVSDNLFTSSYMKKHYQKVFPALTSYFDGTLPPFITSKHIEDTVKKEGLVSKNTKSAHYNMLKGTDAFKDEENLLVIGRYTMNVDAMQQKARILYPMTKKPLDFDYEGRELVYRLKNNKHMSIHQKDYAIGSDIWRLNNHLSRSEILQAIARIRPYDVGDNKKKTVYIFTSQVLDITVDELLPATTFIPLSPRQAGQQIQNLILNLLHANNGILKWKPKDIAKQINIPVAGLHEARKRPWFTRSSEWILMTVTYDKIRNKGRKTSCTDNFIILKDMNIDDQIIHDLNPKVSIKQISIIKGW